MNSDLILKVVLSILAIVSALMSGLLIPYLKTKIDANRRSEIMRIVEVAVTAAEQIFIPDEKGKGRGAEKKEFVINYLYDKGIKVSDEDLDILIEAAVKELNIWQKEFKGA